MSETRENVMRTIQNPDNDRWPDNHKGLADMLVTSGCRVTQGVVQKEVALMGAEEALDYVWACAWLMRDRDAEELKRTNEEILTKVAQNHVLFLGSIEPHCECGEKFSINTNEAVEQYRRHVLAQNS